MNQLQQTIKVPIAPRIPWNFNVTSKQGGNYLTWQAVPNADGYQVDVFLTSDLTTPNTVILKGSDNVAYFDSVPTAQGASPAQRWYRVRATAGTQAQPQSLQGLNTATLASKAIAPNDTVTASVSKTDIATNDFNQGRSRFNNL